LPAFAWQFWWDPIEVSIDQPDGTKTKAYLWTYLGGAVKSGHKEMIDAMAYVTRSPNKSHRPKNAGDPVSQIHMILRYGPIRPDGTLDLKERGNRSRQDAVLVEWLERGSFCGKDNSVCGTITRQAVCLSTEFTVQSKTYNMPERCWRNDTGKEVFESKAAMQ
jgi:hypothetical protein